MGPPPLLQPVISVEMNLQKFEKKIMLKEDSLPKLGFSYVASEGDVEIIPNRGIQLHNLPIWQAGIV